MMLFWMFLIVMGIFIAVMLGISNGVDKARVMMHTECAVCGTDTTLQPRRYTTSDGAELCASCYTYALTLPKETDSGADH